MKQKKKVWKISAITFGLALLMSSCSNNQEPKIVRLATHDSFVMSNSLINEFKAKTGLSIKIIRLGDAGSLTNKLVLTKSNPVADAMFGIDNTFAGVATKNNIIKGKLTPIDFGDVCFNYDVNWFQSRKITPPSSWRDLIDPKYRNLTVVENPKLSSTGLAFLATTYAGFTSPLETEKYWRDLLANGVKVAAGWEDAYYVDFSGSSGKGPKPIVLSYSSSPADEVGKDGKSRTAAMLHECFRQIEYVGVLKNARAPIGATKLVEFMQGDSFQSSMPAAMYVYPESAKIALPANWAKFAPFATSTIGEHLDLQGQRSQWLKEWTAIFGS